MKKNYEKPEVSAVDYRLNQPVAGTCWGLTEDHVQQKTRYYDVKGEGIVSFNVKSVSGSCDAPDAYNIRYITADDHTGSLTEGAKYEAELEAALTKGGGNNGQNYNGIDAAFPQKPVNDSK